MNPAPSTPLKPGTVHRRRPLIGVPGMVSNAVHGMRFSGVAVAAEVLRSIDRAGGEPVVLFPESGAGPAAQLARVDGVVLPGGADVDPAAYGGTPGEHHWPADFAGQDDYDAGLLAAGLDAGIPVLAICRGLQLLNVLYGGTLVPHLDAGSVQHKDAIHPVDVVPDSLLATLTGGTSVDVSSYHHQAVDRLGEGLVVSARASDGVIEALEIPGRPVLAVQWHPEDRAGISASDHAVFRWLVAAASGAGRSAAATPGTAGDQWTTAATPGTAGEDAA